MKKSSTIKIVRNWLLALFLLLEGAGFSVLQAQQESVAMQWNETMLNCIRQDRPRPTVHARNLCHSAIAMWDAWAAYDDCSKPFLLGNTWGNYTCPFDGIPVPADVEAAREEAISYAMYRFLKNRYLTPPMIVPNNAGQQANVLGYIEGRMSELGYDPSVTSTDYTDGDPAKLGNYIAAQIEAYCVGDGANQFGGGTGYANQYYYPVNPEPFNPNFPGNPGVVDPNRWQVLCLQVACQQGTSVEEGNCIPIPDPCNNPALSPEFGNVNPFSMTEDDLTILQRDGHDWWLYHDQGAPPLLDQDSYDGLNSFFKWGMCMVPVWHSFHDPSDGVYIDISPNSVGNIQSYPATGDFAAYQNFYGFFDGTDPSVGYTVNPATGLPYETQFVKRGDFTRVLAEFWADGPHSETPPGHWFTILNEAVSTHPALVKKWMGTGPILSDLEWDVRCYLVLGGGVMDAAIACWGAKGYYDYTRPIYAIRYMADRGQCSDPLQANYHPEGLPLIPGYIEMVEAGDPLEGLNGENIGKVKLYSFAGPPLSTGSSGVHWILAENWWTYQTANFVTPPFPGYMSGHSTYSRTAAEILGAITGDEYFPGGMGQFHAPALTWLAAESGPTMDVTLQWARYIDASDQCSLSRIFGGLHPPQDDIPGRRIGMVLGPEVVAKANSYVEAAIPHISGVTTTTDVINDDAVGSDFTVTIHFTKPMNTSIAPTIAYLDDNPSSTLVMTNGMWADNTTYELTYNVVDMDETLLNVNWKVSGAVGANGETMMPGLSGVVIVDTKNPSVIDSTSDIGDVFTDADAMAVSQMATFTFDEPMNTTVKPAVVFPVEDPGNNITYNMDDSYWMDNTHFVAMLDVMDGNEELADVDVRVTDAMDAHDNLQVILDQMDAFDIDTKNPSVESSVNSDDLLTDVDSGTQFTVVLTFDEAMNLGMNPAIDFSSDVSGTLQMTSGAWDDDMTYTATYDVSDGNEELANVEISAVSAQDANGNMQVMYTSSDMLSIDNRNPLATAIALNDDMVADANVGTNFTVTVTFDEPMGGGNPTIQFPEGGVASTLSYTSGMWINPTTFEAEYEVSDAGVEVSGVDVSAVSAMDAAGNMQEADFTEADAFSIDTRNPLIILSSANTYNITSANTGNNGFEIIAAYDEPMDASVQPTVTFPDEDPTGVITYDAASSTWISSTIFKSVYDVATDLITIQDIDIDVISAKDLAGNEAESYEVPDFFDIHTIVSVGNLDELNGVKVYPNPVHAGGLLSIEWADMPENMTISLINLVGQELLNDEVNGAGEGRYQLNTNGLSSGMYFVRLNSSKGQLILNVQVVK